MTLTKAHIAEKIGLELDVSQRRSHDIVETVLDIMKRTMESGEDVLISGFGKFSVREKEQRLGRNPATGEDLPLAARRVVTFKCSATVRGRMNGKKE